MVNGEWRLVNTSKRLKINRLELFPNAVIIDWMASFKIRRKDKQKLFEISNIE